ncbi:MAG TPA: amidohydrolase family protein, partial [Sphingomicrobium sp.]
MRASRRAVLSGTATAFAAWSSRLLAAADPRVADLVVRNAKVYTVDPALPRAEAFAIRDGRFIAVGANDAIASLIGKGTEIYDAKGMAVVPGFIDCHLHPEGETLLYEVLVGNPFEVEIVTIESIVNKLRERAAKTPPGQWVEGYFYDDTKVKDGRLITRADLDRVSKDHPVAVYHRGGHTSFYNSKAFELA